MTTAQLIAKLQAADPSGELYVFVHGDGRSPYGVTRMDHYYDGREFVVSPGSPLAGTLESGEKVVIRTTDLLTQMFNRADVTLYPIGAAEVSQRMRAEAEGVRAEANAINRSIQEDRE